MFAVKRKAQVKCKSFCAPQERKRRKKLEREIILQKEVVEVQTFFPPPIYVPSQLHLKKILE